MAKTTEYTWSDVNSDLALMTHLTLSEAIDLTTPLQETALKPYDVTMILKSLLFSLPLGDGFNPGIAGSAISRLIKLAQPSREQQFMKPGTRVKARRFGREIDAEVTASGGSTFTVAATDPEDFTVWQDMTYDDVTVIEQVGESMR